MQRTRIYLVRHGQIEGYQEKRYNGQINVPLTEFGKLQSEKVSASLADNVLEAVYSSDLDRSCYCARLIADGHGLVVAPEEALRELSFGEWEGRTWGELQEVYPHEWQKRLQDLTNYQVPGGESLQDAADRIRPVIRRIMQKHPNGDVAMVAHGGVNRIVLLDAIGAELEKAFSIEQDYGCLNIIDYLEDGQSVVRLMNSIAHQNP